MLEIHCFIYIILERKGEGAERGRKISLEIFFKRIYKNNLYVLKFFSIFFYYINLYFFWNICNFIFLE